ncbi:hypothetical protein [Prevotella fusca]|nr:hypothetical protein [Prevotella fusca]
MERTMKYDNISCPVHQRVRHNGRTLLDKSYVWVIISVFNGRLIQ